MISRGTTPTYTFTLPETIDLTAAEKIIVTFAKSDYTKIMDKTGDDIDVSAHSVSVYLTQEETLAFPTSSILVQMNIMMVDGGVTKRIPTEIVRIPTCRNLIDEVIE